MYLSCISHSQGLYMCFTCTQIGTLHFCIKKKKKPNKQMNKQTKDKKQKTMSSRNVFDTDQGLGRCQSSSHMAVIAYCF